MAAFFFTEGVYTAARWGDGEAGGLVLCVGCINRPLRTTESEPLPTMPPSIPPRSRLEARISRYFFKPTLPYCLVPKTRLRGV